MAEIAEDCWLAFAALRDLGVGLALDHAGTGLFGLALLRRLPFTAFKLDRSLVHDVARCQDAGAIVQAMTAVGRALGLTVVGEGINTEQQRALLARYGCAEGQGHLFGRPLSASAVRELFAATGPAPGNLYPVGPA